MLPDQRREKFIESIRTSTVSHTGEEADHLLKPIAELKYEVFSPLTHPAALVTEIAMAFVEKFAGYTPGANMAQSDMLLASTPLIVYSQTPGSTDRTLIWANGFIHLSSDDQLMIAVDKDLIEMLKKDE